MIIIKIDSATNLEKGLKTLKHKVLKTKQNESLKNRKEYEKKSIKIRTQKKKAIYREKFLKNKL